MLQMKELIPVWTPVNLTVRLSHRHDHTMIIQEYCEDSTTDVTEARQDCYIRTKAFIL